MIWGGDHDLEACGYDETGVLSNFSCSKCAATAMVFMPTDEGEEKEN